jgi:pimeloyl-ACP methyl ester carboxylesterase
MMLNALLVLALLAVGCTPATAPPSAPRPSPQPTPATAPGDAPFTVTTTGHGPHVIFIPGLSSPGSVWDRAVAHLATRYTCHVVTLAGFAGAPAMAGDAFLPVERDAILGYVRAQHLERPVLVGHSLGGFLAYWIAATAPGQIAGVLAIDGLPFAPALGDPSATPAGLEPQAAQVRAFLASLDRAQFAHQTTAALQAMITRPGDATRVATDADRSDPRTVGQAVYELMTTDLRPLLGAIPIPVWLIQAGDVPGMREAYEAQVAGAPEHRVVRAAGAKHFVMLDDPDLVDATLDELLAAVQR